MTAPADGGVPRRRTGLGRAAGTLRVVGGVCAAGALAGCVAEGLAEGLTFGVMARWIGVGVATFAVLAAVIVALYALIGPDRAQRRREES